jgi:hypothetical protein
MSDRAKSRKFSVKWASSQLCVRNRYENWLCMLLVWQIDLQEAYKENSPHKLFNLLLDGQHLNKYYLKSLLSYTGARDSIAVKALSYKPEGRGITSRWGGFFLIYLILPAALGPGVDSASNRNEHQESLKNETWG